MKIETKYDIGQRFWVIYKEHDHVAIYDTEIQYIDFCKDGIRYVDKEYNDHEESEIVLYEDTEQMAERIKEILDEIEQEEEKRKKQQESINVYFDEE